jgi:1-acyl-sn-glycerol-3-phosphate acyltransferase
MNGSWLLGASRAIPFLLFTFAMMPIQSLLLAVKSPFAADLPRLYHRWACRILGFNITVRGSPSPSRPTLFVSNHSSYFDVPVLGSLFNCSFIAKSEMVTWPIIGRLARLQRSVFVDRKPSNVGEHSNEIAARLAAGDSLVLFAEGTTSDGNRLLPFKSSLFTVAEMAPPELNLTIQPISIIATGLDGMPLGRAMRPLYAWYGDMPLAPHVWDAMKAGKLTIEVEFHETFTAGTLSRKQLCAKSEAAVEDGVVRAITGRPRRIVAAPPEGAKGDRIVVAA